VAICIAANTCEGSCSRSALPTSKRQPPTTATGHQKRSGDLSIPGFLQLMTGLRRIRGLQQGWWTSERCARRLPPGSGGQAIPPLFWHDPSVKRSDGGTSGTNERRVTVSERSLYVDRTPRPCAADRDSSAPVLDYAV